MHNNNGGYSKNKSKPGGTRSKPRPKHSLSTTTISTTTITENGAGARAASALRSKVLTTPARSFAIKGRPLHDTHPTTQTHHHLSQEEIESQEISRLLKTPLQQPDFRRPVVKEPVPDFAVDQFLKDEPALKELMEAASRGETKKANDHRANVKTGERLFIQNMADDYDAVMELQHQKLMDEQHDEEALIDSLLYDRASNDPHEKQLRVQHKQLKDKQQFLKQQRVINMNEFIKPPVSDKMHYIESQLNNVTSNHAELVEESLERRREQEEFQQLIELQRQRLQKQLDEAVVEEKAQLKQAKKEQKKLLKQQKREFEEYQKSLKQPTQPAQQAALNAIEAGDSELEAGDDDTELDEAQQRRRRIGPGVGQDFLSNHFGLFDGQSSSLHSTPLGDPLLDSNDTMTPYDRYIQRKRQKKHNLPDGDLDDMDQLDTSLLNSKMTPEDLDAGDDLDDDLDDAAKLEFNEDINDILNRQYLTDPGKNAHGIVYDDLDSDEDSDEDSDNTTHSESHRSKKHPHQTKQSKRLRRNKFGNLIAEEHDNDDGEIDGNIDPLDGIEIDTTPDKHRSDINDVGHDGRDVQENQGEHDQENEHEGDVQDFEFPERVDPGVKNQKVKISHQWWKRVSPIIGTLKNALQNPKSHTNRFNLLEGLDTAAKLLLELSARPDIPDIPRQVFAVIINMTIPPVKTIAGIPQGAARPATAALGPFLLLIMTTARQNHVKFSDVEWQWVLTTIAQTANPVNVDEVKTILTDTIDLFRRSKVIRGVRIQRAHSKAVRVVKKSPIYTKYALISAPNVRLIEQRAWLEFYSYSNNRDLLLPFTRIHDAVVFKPAMVETPLTRMGFIADHIGDDIMSRPHGIDFHRVDEAYDLLSTDQQANPMKDKDLESFGFGGMEDDPLFNELVVPGTPVPVPPPRTKDHTRMHKFAHYKDQLHNTLEKPFSAQGNVIRLDDELTAIRTEKAFKNWVSPDHHPQLFNYPTEDGLPHLAYMAAGDDILSEPWMYQPPHFKEQFLPRMSAQFRNDNLAFFPSCISTMAHFTAQGTADVAQAEQFYKYIVTIFTNTEGYYRAVLRDLKKIDKYRTLHGYEPAEDVQMAQNMEAPEGEEFRYFAGYPLIDGIDFQSWRKRATQTIISMTKLLGKLYRYENRTTQIQNLIQYLLEQKRLFPALIPVPSLSLLQQHFNSAIRNRDVGQARQTVTLMLHLRRMVATPDDDPLMQLSLRDVRLEQTKIVRAALRHTSIARQNNRLEETYAGVGTNRRYKDQTFQHSVATKRLMQRMGQASFDSLQRELDVAVIMAQAAIYAVTNNFVAMMELIDSLQKTRDVKLNGAEAANAKAESHDYLKSLQYVGAETKTRLFRVLLNFLSTSTMNTNSHVRMGSLTASDTQAKVESIYYRVKIDFDTDQAQKYSPQLLEQLTPEARQQFEELRTQLFHKRVRDMIQPIYDELLTPKPLIDYRGIVAQSGNLPSNETTRMTTPATLQPGHIMWMFHQAQRNGAALTPRLIHDTLNLLASFPGNVGSYAAYHFVNDMLGLGFRISRPTLRVISSNARVQAQLARPTLNKLYPNQTIHTIYQQLKDTAVTIPQLLDRGRTELPSVFFKEFSFIHPSTTLTLAKHKKIPLSAEMIQDTILYFGYTRNWVAAVDSFRNALDIAYFGSYAVAKRICKAQNIPFSQFTDSLPIKQRRIAFNARKALFMTSSFLGHHRLTFDIISDWQQADGVRILPFTPNFSGYNDGQLRSSSKLGDIAHVRLFPTDINDPRFVSIAPLLSHKFQQTLDGLGDGNNVIETQPSEQQLEEALGKNDSSNNPTQLTVKSHVITRKLTQEEVQLQLQEQIAQLPFDQQKLLIQTVTKIKQNRQPPLSQHFNITKHTKIFNDLNDLSLVAHTPTNIVWQRRFMEASGISPTWSTMTKILTNAVALATHSPTNTLIRTHRQHPQSRINALKLHISRVNNADTLHLPPGHMLYSPTLSAATPITQKTNKQIGLEVDYSDFKSLDDYQLKQARVIHAIEPYWDEIKDNVLKSDKLTQAKRSQVQLSTVNDATRQHWYTSQLDEELRTKLLPNHYSKIHEHTLTIKLAAQRLLDHYPFNNAQEAIRVICNTRTGLGDLGLEYEPHKTPLLTTPEVQGPGTNLSPLVKKKRAFLDNERAIGTALQQHQRSYQNMTKMKHENIILPLSLTLDSPVLHVPGLGLHVQVPTTHDVPELEEAVYPPSTDDSEGDDQDSENTPLSKSLCGDNGSDDSNGAKRVKDVVKMISKRDLFQTKWTKRFNLMIGTEHIDATLTELYWRGLTLTPFHIYDVVNRMLEASHRLTHVSQTGLMAIPYLAALTHNMSIFPLLDRYSRPAHSLSSTNTRQHHTVNDLDAYERTNLNKVSADGNEMVNEVEERVIGQFSQNLDTNNHNVSLQTDNTMLTLNKLSGAGVTYQHQIIKLQVNTTTQLHKQLTMTLHDIISSLQTPSQNNFQKQRRLIPYSAQQRSKREKEFTPRQAINFNTSAPFPALLNLPSKLSKSWRNLGYNGTMDYVSLLSDHFHGLDLVLRRLVDYLPPLNSPDHTLGRLGKSAGVSSAVPKYHQLLDELINTTLTPQSQHDTTPNPRDRQEILVGLALEQNAMTVPSATPTPLKQFTPVIPEAALPTMKPSKLPRFYNPKRHSKTQQSSDIEEVPDFTPKSTNYTESSIFHLDLADHRQLLSTLSQLPLLQANMNHILFHPQFTDDFLALNPDLHEKGVYSSNFDFAPRVTTNAKQSQLIFMLLARYNQPGHLMEQHITNWNDAVQHGLEMIHLAFKQLFNLDLSNQGAPLAKDDPHHGVNQRINTILGAYKNKQDPTTTRSQLIFGLLDIAQSTVPTTAQLDWFRNIIGTQNDDIGLLTRKLEQVNSETEPSLTLAEVETLKNNIHSRKQFTSHLENFVEEMESCVKELQSIMTYLPHEVQFNATSTYTQHVTLTPAPYHPETSDVQSQSYKLWSREALLTLQSIRLAPNQQQLAVISNTGPIVNYQMFDENHLIQTAKKIGEHGIQNPDFYPLDPHDAAKQAKRKLQATATPAEIVVFEEDENLPAQQ